MTPCWRRITTSARIFPVQRHPTLTAVIRHYPSTHLKMLFSYCRKCTPLRLLLTHASVRPATTSARAMLVPHHVRPYRYFPTPDSLSPQLLGLLSVRGPNNPKPPRAPECPRSRVPELLSGPTGPILFLHYLDSSCLQLSS